MNNDNSPRTVSSADTAFRAAVVAHIADLADDAYAFPGPDALIAAFDAIDPTIFVDLDTAIDRYIDAGLDAYAPDELEGRDLLIAWLVTITES